MKTSELLKIFKKNNISLKEQGKRHDTYYSPITGKTIPVLRYKAEIKTGTLNSILKGCRA